MQPGPQSRARQIRQTLKDGGSLEHSAGVQRYFKQEIKSYGWYTKDLRKLAQRERRAMLAAQSLEFLIGVADRLFRGNVLEEKSVAVCLLEKSAAELGSREFLLFESWLDRVTTWADHDALVHDLIAPMLLAGHSNNAKRPARDPASRMARVMAWSRSPDRWHRRASAVALIRGCRRCLFFTQVEQVTERLLGDRDDMVQKGLGWLLRENAKADPQRTIPLLLQVRDSASRLVLRTACETLAPAERARVLLR
jgi:3-methyladenine DNA glycosylase AlkD